MLEMLMKLLALGVVLPLNAYLRDPWNWMDGAIALVRCSDRIEPPVAAEL